MGILSINYRTTTCEFHYQNEPQDHFYFTNNIDDILQNCRGFDIDLYNENKTSPHDFTALEDGFVITSQAGGKLYQYLTLDMASEGDKIEFAQKRPRSIAEKIYQRLGLDYELSEHIEFTQEKETE